MAKEHPALRLDAFLKATDPLYKGDGGRSGSVNFLRPMPMYGANRPSPCFTSESRVRKFPGLSVDMGNLPPVLYDHCVGDTREGCILYPPFTTADDSFLERYKRHGLMLPSERLEDHKIIKAKTEEWRKQRDSIFFYKKQTRIVQRKHREGIAGIDYPLREGTVLYERDHKMYFEQEAAKEHHESRRRQFLQDMTRSSECLTEEFGSYPAAERGSADLGMQRKFVDKKVHPVRWRNTYSVLWPTHVPMWDPGRAKALRLHDVRHKTTNFMNGADNDIQNMVERVL